MKTLVARCRREFSVIAVACLVVTIIWGISNRGEITEAIRAATCRAPCPSLTPEQLRLEVVKAYLHLQLDLNIERHDSGGKYQLALLPRDMTAQDVERSITDSSLLEVLTANTILLGSHAQIDALDVDSLAHDPSIAVYSLVHREAQIIPTRSIQKASATEVESYFRASRTGMPAFSSWERLRGYGRQFFWIDQYWPLELACCDGSSDYRGHSSDWWKKYTLQSRKYSRPWLMAVSDYGAILIRKHDDDDNRVVF